MMMTQYNDIILLFFSVLLIIVLGNAVAVVLARNPVTAILHLIVVFAAASFLLLFFSLEFFAWLFLAIYVGAIAVFFLFSVMLFNIPAEASLSREADWPRVWASVGLVVVGLVSVVFLINAVVSVPNLMVVPSLVSFQIGGLYFFAKLLFSEFLLYVLVIGWYLFGLLVGVSLIFRS